MSLHLSIPVSIHCDFSGIVLTLPPLLIAWIIHRKPQAFCFQNSKDIPPPLPTPSLVKTFFALLASTSILPSKEVIVTPFPSVLSWVSLLGCLLGTVASSYSTGHSESCFPWLSQYFRSAYLVCFIIQEALTSHRLCGTPLGSACVCAIRLFML